MTGGIHVWLTNLSLLSIGFFLLTGVLAAAWAGHSLRKWRERNIGVDAAEQRDQEASIVSGLLGLLALLLAFTFSLVIDRYEVRRELVITDSNSIGTAYLRVQLLPEPHRARLSKLLLNYTHNRILLARAQRGEVHHLLANDDHLLADIWSATIAAHDAIKTLPLSRGFLDSMNVMIDADSSRRQARLAHLPNRVLSALLLYLVITGAVFGYLLSGKRARIAAAILMGLLAISLLLIIDIDQPNRGRIVESQAPMEAVLEMLKNQPPGSYDRWRKAE
jgi:hypothetical protein